MRISTSDRRAGRWHYRALNDNPTMSESYMADPFIEHRSDRIADKLDQGDANAALQMLRDDAINNPADFSAIAERSWNKELKGDRFEIDYQDRQYRDQCGMAIRDTVAGISDMQTGQFHVAGRVKFDSRPPCHGGNYYESEPAYPAPDRGLGRPWPAPQGDPYDREYHRRPHLNRGPGIRIGPNGIEIILPN